MWVVGTRWPIKMIRKKHNDESLVTRLMLIMRTMTMMMTMTMTMTMMPTLEVAGLAAEAAAPKAAPQA